MQIIRLSFVAIITFALMGMGGCQKQTADSTNKPSGVKAEAPFPGDESPEAVLFDIKPASDSLVTVQIYDCTYQARGRTAKFRLQLGEKKPIHDEIPVASTTGRFLAVKGSDNSALLEDLKIALDAKKIPTKSSRVQELAFDAVILGEKQSRSLKGGFSSDPPGDWMTIKIFLPKGNDDGEVFLNLNPSLGKGEFSMKDSDYGDYLLTEFAKVL